ncbi:hypothetical protein ACFWP3_09940, partial [Streptomyces sp. NPDC058525]
MNATNALRTVEMIRCASKAASGHRAARRALHEARAEQAALSVDHILGSGSDAYEVAREHTRRTERRLQRAASKLHTWRPTLNRYPTEHQLHRATRNLLEHLADDAVSLITAADLVLIQTSYVLYPVPVVVRTDTPSQWQPRGWPIPACSQCPA